MGFCLLGCGNAPLAPHLWIPAFAGMTSCPAPLDSCLRRNARMTLGEWVTPQWFVVGFPRPATVHTLREPQDGLRFPSARTVAPRPYLPSHFRPAREGQGNHKGCPYGGTTVGGAGVCLLGCGNAPFAPHLWIPAFAGMTLGEWATPRWFVVGFPRPGSYVVNGFLAPARTRDTVDFPQHERRSLPAPSPSLRVRGRATTRVAPTGANVGNHGEVPGVLLFEGNS